MSISKYYHLIIIVEHTRLIAIPIKREVEGAEGAVVVELGEIDLVGEVGGAPVAL